MKSKEEIIKFIETEVSLGFCKKEYGERLKWYFETYFESPTTSVSAKEFLKTRKEFYTTDGKFEATDEFGEGLVAAALHDFASRKPAGMRWVKASDRLPDSLKEVIVKTMIAGKKVSMYARREHMGDGSKMLLIYNGNHIATLSCEWLDESTPAEYSLDNGVGTTTVYGGKPAGEGYVCQYCK